MTEQLWIDETDAMVLHDRLLALHGGAAGVREEALLKSALARPQQHFASSEHADIIHLATVYTAAIVRNHLFVDGNKRTGFVVGTLFLEINGFDSVATEEEAAAAVLALASGDFNDNDYEAFLQDNVRQSGPGPESAHARALHILA